MAIKRIDSKTPNLQSYIDIPVSEIREIHNKIIHNYETNLKKYGVKKLWTDIPANCSDETFISLLNAKELQLIFLYKCLNCFVHKDVISMFVRKYIPNAAFDQQVRHLGTQDFWDVLNKGAKVPNSDERVPSGYNYLVSIERANQKVLAEALKRAGRIAAKTFEDLKLVYDCKCATCGIREGDKDTRNNEVVVLQQGHMNPRQQLTLDNTIPQCQYCNQTYKDYFVFDVYGRVVAVNNPQILLKSPKSIQDEMISVLLQVREKKQ